MTIGQNAKLINYIVELAGNKKKRETKNDEVMYEEMKDIIRFGVGRTGREVKKEIGRRAETERSTLNRQCRK